MAGQLIKVLVVDDDESVRVLLQRFLEGAGYQVVTAEGGQEALDKVTVTDFGVALLDITMPGLSGIEVLRWLSENKPDVCPIMVTAVADVHTAVEAMKLGAYDYITKPFVQEVAIEKIRSSLSRKHAEIEENMHRLNLEKKVIEQTQQLQNQFTELVETLAREHGLLYRMSISRQDGVKSFIKKLPPELQEPMSSIEEFSEALLRILKRQTVQQDENNNQDVKTRK